MKRALLAFFAASVACYSGAQQKPDSVERYSFDEFTQEYNEHPSGSTLYTYDQNGNVVERISRSQNLNSQKYTYVYSNDKLFEDIRYNWNASTSSWYPTERYQRLRNQFGVDTARIRSIYDTTTQSWVDNKWYVYSIEYDTIDRPIFSTYKEYDAAVQTWTIHQRIRFMYSGTDTIPSELFVDTWDGMNWNDEFWAPRVEWEMGFSPNLDYFQPTMTLGYEWDGTNWIGSYYDSSVVVDGKIEDYYAYGYDIDSMNFLLSWSEHYTFDLHENETSRLYLNWEAGTSDTSSYELNIFTYGSSGEILENVNRSFVYLGGMMEYRSKFIYYYGTTSLVSAQKETGTLYPNPISSSQTLYIKSEQVIESAQLYSGNGNLLRNWTNLTDEGLRMQGLAPGLYFIRLTDAAGNQSTQRLQVR